MTNKQAFAKLELTAEQSIILNHAVELKIMAFDSEITGNAENKKHWNDLVWEAEKILALLQPYYDWNGLIYDLAKDEMSGDKDND